MGKGLTSKKGEISLEEALSLIKAWCATREVCVLEAKIKMKKWNISPENSEKVIIILKDSNYIDEQRYAKAFASDKMGIDKWGPNKVKQTLLQKGISESYINSAIAEKKEDINESAIVLELLNKKLRSLKSGLNNHETYTKLMRFGLSRGFDYSLVSKFAKELSKADVD